MKLLLLAFLIAIAFAFNFYFVGMTLFNTLGFVASYGFLMRRLVKDLCCDQVPLSF